MVNGPGHGHGSREQKVTAAPQDRLPARPAISANQSYRIIKEERRTTVIMGGVMAKFHSRPSAQYRYEHYDPQA